MLVSLFVDQRMESTPNFLKAKHRLWLQEFLADQVNAFRGYVLVLLGP